MSGAHLAAVKGRTGKTVKVHEGAQDENETEKQ
jgi:hypothetical protein